MHTQRVGISRLFATVAALALLPVCQARAEAVATTTPDTRVNLSEVIVTAQRRAERLQDVPLSVTAVNAQSLERAGITTTKDLALVTPGLRLNQGGVFVQPVIRGITTSLTGVNVDANIATYIDGVYQQSMFAAFYNLPDVQEVEVLKGPQGTLFGRNATGGAILINTQAPNLTRATGQLTAGYARFNDYYSKGFVSVPIIQDKLAASIAYYGEHTDGWKRNIITGKRGAPIDDILVRGKVRFVPWDGADFTLTGLYSNEVNHDALKNTNYMGNTQARQLLPLSQIAVRPNDFSSNLDTVSKPKSASISLRGTIEAGPGTITTTTAYSRVTQTLLTDGDVSPLAFSAVAFPDAIEKTFTQEVVYTTHKIGRFQGTAGAFYYWNEADFLPLSVNNFAQSIWTIDKSRAAAVFGELSYDLTDRVSLTGGLRYSTEKRRAFAAFTTSSVRPNIPLLGERSWDSFTPRASIRYKASDQANLYFTYSQGFKSGIFNTASLQAAPANPEKIRSYEVGIKSNISRDLTLNAAAFYYDYRGLQTPTIQQNGATFVQVLKNAANAKIKGVEVNGAWNLTDQFSMSFGGTYLHARYSDFPNAVVNIPLATGGAMSVQRDVSGNTMVGSPTWSGNLTARYVQDTKVGQFDASATGYYSSKIFYDVGDRVNQPSFLTLNATLAWRPERSNWEVRIYGRNLTNKLVIQSSTLSTFAEALNYSPPRIYGAEVKYSF